MIHILLMHKLYHYQCLPVPLFIQVPVPVPLPPTGFYPFNIQLSCSGYHSVINLFPPSDGDGQNRLSNLQYPPNRRFHRLKFHGLSRGKKISCCTLALYWGGRLHPPHKLGWGEREAMLTVYRLHCYVCCHSKVTLLQ